MSIEKLLRRRNSRLLSEGGDTGSAEARLMHSKYLAENFTYFDILRTHLFHPNQHPTVNEKGLAEAPIHYLMNLGWIARAGRSSFRINGNDDVHAYLAGGWLEELVFLAHRAAGVDEAYFGQQIEWQVNETYGENEIDVIARRGETLSFTSCKTLRAEKANGHMGTLRNFLTETDYWNIHFAEDRGKALLVTTTDMVDEMNNNRERYPALLARATILNVSVAGLEHLQWDRLVDVIEKHWQ